MNPILSVPIVQFVESIPVCPLFQFNSSLEFNVLRLPAPSTTDALFDQIVIPTGVTNADAFDSDTAERIEYSVDVKAQAVQAQGAKASWAAVQAMKVPEIAAWFGTCGL